MAVATRPATSAAFAGRIRVLELLARFAKASTYCCATLRFAASRPPLPSIASATARTPAPGASARTRIAGASASGLLIAGGEVRLLLALALRLRARRALLALRRDLRLHRAQDGLRRRQALDLVAQDLDAPVASRLVERVHDLAVDFLARLEGLVELHLADLAAQRGLRELAHRHDVVRGAVGCEAR